MLLGEVQCRSTQILHLGGSDVPACGCLLDRPDDAR